MKTRWISSLQDRPRCRVADGDGLRCREPVLWDERTNRPLSTRCGAHGGLADAAVMGWRSLDLNETRDKIEPARGAVNVLANSVKKLSTIGLGGSLGGLPALALAGALCLFFTVPALADFESAVAAYERGAYEEAKEEFESLAVAGDERAEPYLERISGKLHDESQPGGSVTSTLMESVSSVFGGSAASGSESSSGAAASGTRASEAAQPGKAAPDRTASGWHAWSPSDQASEPAPAPPVDSDVVTPQRGSIWSAIFHLPGDATVIGLQYVAQFLSADNLHRELQILSRNSDRIALSILAVGWWLVIIKVLIGIAMAISRFMKVAATPKEQIHYG